MGAWGEGLLSSDAAQEAVDCFIVNVQALKRPLTDRPTLVKVFKETLDELNPTKGSFEDEIESGFLSAEVLAIAEHLRLHGVTVAPLFKWVRQAYTVELDRAVCWNNPRKRKGRLNQFAERVGL